MKLAKRKSKLCFRGSGSITAAWLGRNCGFHAHGRKVDIVIDIYDKILPRHWKAHQVNAPADKDRDYHWEALRTLPSATARQGMPESRLFDLGNSLALGYAGNPPGH